MRRSLAEAPFQELDRRVRYWLKRNDQSLLTGGSILTRSVAELPPFETDNVGAGGKVFLNTFPYLGVPH